MVCIGSSGAVVVHCARQLDTMPLVYIPSCEESCVAIWQKSGTQ